MSTVDSPDPAVPASLTTELIDLLGLLHRAPPGMAEATLSLLPYGSRTSLVAHGFIEKMDGGAEDAVEIQITDAGWDVIGACSRVSSRRRLPSDRTDSTLAQIVAALERQLPTLNISQLSARIKRDK